MSTEFQTPKKFIQVFLNGDERNLPKEAGSYYVHWKPVIAHGERMNIMDWEIWRKEVPAQVENWLEKFDWYLQPEPEVGKDRHCVKKECVMQDFNFSCNKCPHYLPEQEPDHLDNLQAKEQSKEEPLKNAIERLKNDAIKSQQNWQFPNEHHIEASGIIMACDQILEWIQPSLIEQPVSKENLHTANYMHVCIKLECKSCGHKGWDVDFKKETFIEYKTNCSVVITHFICPECGSIDNFKSTDQQEAKQPETLKSAIGKILDRNLQLDMPRPVKAKMQVVREIIALFEDQFKNR